MSFRSHKEAEMILLLEDTRQVESKHELKHAYFREHGIHWNRTALYCGDYTLPGNQSVCVDTKKDIAELIGDIQVKKMPKKGILANVNEICWMNQISLDIGDSIYHAITDDDSERFAEKEINDICFQNGVSESVAKLFQTLYVKRHGFFHRGLLRAKNSGIELYVLVENRDGVKDINDLFYWHNPRLNIWKNTDEVVGRYKNGRPKYRKVRKYPTATTGEQLAKSCLTMELKYGVKFRFCTPEDSGKNILSILGVNDV